MRVKNETSHSILLPSGRLTPGSTGDSRDLPSAWLASKLSSGELSEVEETLRTSEPVATSLTPSHCPVFLAVKLARLAARSSNDINMLKAWLLIEHRKTVITLIKDRLSILEG